jgi:hypothetical protein
MFSLFEIKEIILLCHRCRRWILLWVIWIHSNPQITFLSCSCPSICVYTSHVISFLSVLRSQIVSHLPTVSYVRIRSLHKQTLKIFCHFVLSFVLTLFWVILYFLSPKRYCNIIRLTSFLTEEKDVQEYQLNCVKFVRISRIMGPNIEMLPLEGSTLWPRIWRVYPCGWNSL